MPTWIEALKMYYSGKTFMIPKKGSEDYDAVKKLMSGEPAAASSPPKMTDAPRKVTVEELRAKYLAKKKAMPDAPRKVTVEQLRAKYWNKKNKILNLVEAAMKKGKMFVKDSGGEDSERSYSIRFPKPEGLSSKEVAAACVKLTGEGSPHDPLGDDEKNGLWDFNFMTETHEEALTVGRKFGLVKPVR